MKWLFRKGMGGKSEITGKEKHVVEYFILGGESDETNKRRKLDKEN